MRYDEIDVISGGLWTRGLSAGPGPSADFSFDTTQMKKAGVAAAKTPSPYGGGIFRFGGVETQTRIW